MVAVVGVILGQAVLLADWHPFGYGALIWLFFDIVVIAYEEPTLRESEPSMKAIAPICRVDFPDPRWRAV